MDEARNVLLRLDRLDRLERDGAPAEALLREVRLLVHEAERWLRAEPAAPTSARVAVEAARAAVERDEGRWRTLVA